MEIILIIIACWYAFKGGIWVLAHICFYLNDRDMEQYLAAKQVLIDKAIAEQKGE